MEHKGKKTLTQKRPSNLTKGRTPALMELNKHRDIIVPNKAGAWSS